MELTRFDGHYRSSRPCCPRLRDPSGARLLAEVQRHELAALVGVPDQPGVGPAVRQCHLQSVDDEFLADVVGDAPADDPARVEVLHGDEVQHSHVRR
jgi:hypothetical protein